MMQISNRRLQAAKRGGRMQYKLWRILRISFIGWTAKHDKWKGKPIVADSLEECIQAIDEVEAGIESVLENEQSGG